MIDKDSAETPVTHYEIQYSYESGTSIRFESPGGFNWTPERFATALREIADIVEIGTKTRKEDR